MSKEGFDLEERLIDFAVRVINVTEALPNDYLGKHIRGQLVRSGTAPAPNYGEAQGAESSADFVHKMKLSLKELRETMVWLKIIHRKELISPSRLNGVLEECDELVEIFVKSIQTAKHNRECG
jgi:four helix bundle protein